MSLQIIILAAGQGKRMFSALPKVLHPIGGKPMLAHVIETANQLNPAGIHVIVGHGSDQIQACLNHVAVNWVLQEQQLGTGHAVMQALPFISNDSQVLILSGDVPLIQLNTLQSLIQGYYLACETAPTLGLLLANLPNPTGLGRIIRNNQGHVTAIVEEKDANEQQRNIHEIYSGICIAESNHLHRWLPKLSSNNAQQEYYLTEILSMAVAENASIFTSHANNPTELQGVNNRLQLQQLEREWQKHHAEQLMLGGVSLADASRIDVRGKLECGQDVFIDVNNLFVGHVKIGDHCTIEPNCQLTNVTLGSHCHILANSVLENCRIDDHCHVGPFARLRTGTQLASQCKIGNFVETKNVILGVGTKANHLSYLGDAQVGRYVNIGAGTITCNYDGANKHQTIIEDNVNIGSDTQLVAPVTVGENATIGAGSTIRKDVPPAELTLTVSAQKTIYGWKRKVKQKASQTEMDHGHL